MDKTITAESVIQLIALHRDHDGRSAKVIADLDPWQSHELIWKLLTITDWILDLAATDDRPAEEILACPAEEILAGILDNVKGVNDERS